VFKLRFVPEMNTNSCSSWNAALLHTKWLDTWFQRVYARFH